MKKIIKTSIMLLPLMAMILFAHIDPQDPSDGGNRQCPGPNGGPIWNGPLVYEYEIATDCSLRVVYCHRILHTGEPEIFIHDFEAVGGGCNMVPQSSSGMPTIDWINNVYTQILDTHYRQEFWSLIEPCGSSTHGEGEWKYVVKNLVCYQMVAGYTGDPPIQTSWYMETCNEDEITQCYEFFKVCRMFVDGQWIYYTEPGPDHFEEINCDTPCINYFCD